MGWSAIGSYTEMRRSSPRDRYSRSVLGSILSVVTPSGTKARVRSANEGTEKTARYCEPRCTTKSRVPSRLSCARNGSASVASVAITVRAPTSMTLMLEEARFTT